MRRVVFKIHVSLDGYIRAAGTDPLGWMFRTYDDEMRAWEVELLRQAGAHVMGRVLYEEMAAYWPGSTEPWAAPMNEIPKVVFSRTLKRAPWRETHIADGEVVEEMARLKGEPGKDVLVHGGAAFVQSLAQAGLLDEYHFLVHPVVLGSGLPLFRKQPLSFALVDMRRFPGGAVLMSYRPGNGTGAR